MDNGTLPENRTILAKHASSVGLDSNEIAIVDLLRTLLRYKWVTIATALFVLTCSITYAFTATPFYRAETILAPPGSSSGGLGGLMSQFGGSLGGLANMFMGGGGSSGQMGRGQALTTLTSTAHIQSFIEEKGLLPILFADLWDADKGNWKVDSEEDVPTLFDGYNLFKDKLLKIDEDPLTQIIALSVDWKDPKLAAEWANELVSTLNTRSRQRAMANSDKTIEFLNQELERTKVVELRQALFFMIEQEIGKKTNARVSEEFAFKVINPAIAPDLDKFTYPNRTLIIAAGFFGGIIIGLFAAFLAQAIGRLRHEYSSGANN